MFGFKNHRSHHGSPQLDFHRLRSQRGSAIVYALTLSVIGIIMVGALSSYYLNLVGEVVRNREVDSLRMIMNSAMDYTLGGIRSRWCFTSSWSMNGTCLLTDDRNVERLLLSDEALRALESSMEPVSYGGDISKVRLKSISTEVRWGDITEDHPLYSAIQGLRNFGQDFVFRFSVVRMDNGVQKGREVALNVRVELSLGSIAGMDIGDHMVLNSTVMVFPRELNTNALVIGNHLFLDRGDPGVAAAAPGNVYISPQFKSDLPGLRFESPVYVNGNVYVPMPDAPGFTPVTFADKLILGFGNVLESRGNTAFYSAPRTAGGMEDRYYSQAKNFGGFLKGVLLDPGTDKGLEYLVGVKSAGKIDLSSTNLCILRNAAKADLSLTRNSQLYLRLNAGTIEPASNATINVTSRYQLTANLGLIDNFYKQGTTGDQQFTAFAPNEVQPTVKYTATSSDEKRPIMRVTVALNGYTGLPGAFVAVDMGRETEVKIPMNKDDSGAYILLRSSPFRVGEQNNIQANAVNFQVEFVKQEAFTVTPYTVQQPGFSLVTAYEPSININIEAFDVAYTTSRNSSGQAQIVSNRSGESAHPVMGKYKANSLSFKRTPGGADKRFVLQRPSLSEGRYFTCSRFNATCLVYDETATPQDIDLVAFDQACNSPPKGTDMFPSFKAADWNEVDFSSQARHSWGFTEPGSPGSEGYNPGTLIIDSGFAALGGVSPPVFVVSAIYNTCRIRSSANFVTGFFVCDNLIIERRTEPLRIIGTFIVGHMSIDNSAMESGIRWSNIYYPTAVYELRKAGVLKTSVPGEDCDIPSDPLWQPYPSIIRAQFLYKCNPIYLRSKADPFKWTMVDPDCGLLDGRQACKYRVMRYELVELRRQEIL